jgi:quercetin dioxygenase-like cupin family protein
MKFNLQPNGYRFMILPRKTTVARSAALALLFVGHWASGAQPAAISSDSVHWVSPPNLPGVQGAWFLGAQDKPGVYLFRVKLAPGARIPPHTHPDERNSTVMSGTLYVGFGDTFDEARMVAVPPGAVYVAPANLPHYLWARDGEVVYQESGIGPTATRMLTGAGPR